MLRRSVTGSTVATAIPPPRTTPWSGSTSRLKQRSNVVLPEPLSPTSARQADGAISSETSSRASVEPYVLERRSTESAIGAVVEEVDDWLITSRAARRLSAPAAPSSRRRRRGGTP